MLRVLPVFLLIAIVVIFIVTAYKEGKANVGTTKRLYFYLLSFAALLVAANGLIMLLNFIVDRLSRLVIAGTATSEQLGLSLAFLLVGSALWVPHWLYIQRQVKKSAAETESSLRKLYLYALLFISLVYAVITLVQLLGWVFKNDSFNSSMVSGLVVWIPLWLYHWRLESKEGQPSPEAKILRHWYIYLTSFYSLAMIASGLGFILFAFLRSLYNDIFPLSVLVGERQPLWGRGTRTALSVAIAGAPVWIYHWYKIARPDIESTLRQVYLYLYAILLGALTILTTLTLGIYQVLSWILGASKAPGAADHFRVMPAIVAPFTLGLVLWVYHWNTVQQESRRLAFRLLAARRAYTYFMAALGLGTIAAGLIIMIPTIIDIFIPGARGVLAGADWWRGRTGWVLTLLITGIPWWSYFWLNVQRQAIKGGAEERAALTRRLHIYIVLVLSMLSVLGSLVFTVYTILQAALGGTLSPEVFRRAKWGIGVFVTASLIAYYYWLALREDLAVGAEKIARKAQVTLVAGEQSQILVPQLEEKLGYKLKVILRLEAETKIPGLTEEQLEILSKRIQESKGAKVLLIVEEDDVKVFSYQ